MMKFLLLFILLDYSFAQEDPKKLISPEWMHAEQALPSETPTGSNIRNYISLFTSDAAHNGDMEKQYHPKAAQVFALGEYNISEDEALILSKNGEIPEEFIHFDNSGKRTLVLPFHPSQSEHYGVDVLEQSRYQGTPSSSARSMFVKMQGKDELVIIKGSLNMGMGGFSRLIPVDEALRSHYNSAIFEQLHTETQGKLGESGKKWGFFPEVASIFPADPSKGGSILRTVPSELLDKNQTLLPMYSLIADQKNSRGKKLPTWIEKLYRDSGYSNKEKFIIENFTNPMMELFSIISYKGGLTSQMHQQNLLAHVEKVNGKYKVVGFYLRDMEALFPVLSFEKHFKIKRDFGLWDFVDAAKAKAKGVHLSAMETHRYEISSSRFLQGYREDLRHNSVKSIFKYFLNKNEMDNVMISMDKRMVRNFNRSVPEMFRTRGIQTFEKAFFEFDAKVLKKYAPDILKQRRIFNERIGLTLSSYERWLSDSLKYVKRPSEKLNLCFFYLKNFFNEKILKLPRSRY